MHISYNISRELSFYDAEQIKLKLNNSIFFIDDNIHCRSVAVQCLKCMFKKTEINTIKIKKYTRKENTILIGFETVLANI